MGKLRQRLGYSNKKVTLSTRPAIFQSYYLAYTPLQLGHLATIWRSGVLRLYRMLLRQLSPSDEVFKRADSHIALTDLPSPEMLCTLGYFGQVQGPWNQVFCGHWLWMKNRGYMQSEAASLGHSQRFRASPICLLAQAMIPVLGMTSSCSLFQVGRMLSSKFFCKGSPRSRPFPWSTARHTATSWTLGTGRTIVAPLLNLRSIDACLKCPLETTQSIRD